jgi:hypothetical protein
VSGLPVGLISTLTVKVETVCLRATVIKLAEHDYRFTLTIDERPVPGSPVGPFLSVNEARQGAKHNLTAWIIEVLGRS